jgi:hypothetical protein
MQTLMNRREAVIRMATLMGASVLGPRLLTARLDAANAPAAATAGFSATDIALLDEIGDTILPATDVPGAKAVQIGAFIAMMVNDCVLPRDHAAFREGLAKIDATHRTRFGGPFVSGTSVNRTALLNELDREQQAYTRDLKARFGDKSGDEPQHYFRTMKELTILGYFSSEIGATQALRFVETPGSYNGAAPYKKGDRAWFS